MIEFIKNLFRQKALKQVWLLSLRKKVTVYHGLGGFVYEYKTVIESDYYSNSNIGERLEGLWEIIDRDKCVIIKDQCNEQT